MFGGIGGSLAVSDPTNGISYNGVNFDAATETLEVTKTPVYDQAGRTVIYSVISITLQGLVHSAKAAGILSGTDAVMTIDRVLLEQPGGAFDYSNQGFGTLSVNLGGAKDVAWGPKPKLLRWKPIGGRYAAEVTWRVEIALPDSCALASTPATDRVYEKRLLAFNYRLVINKDSSGYSKRTYTGYIQIPMTRIAAGNPELPDHVDKYWEQAWITTPEGFRRISEDRQISEDKCRLDFTIVDEEMTEIAPPPGIIVAKMSYGVNNASPGPGFSQWNANLSASYEVARGVNKRDAIEHFFLVLNDKYTDVKTKLKDNSAVILTALSVAWPEIYGRTTCQASASMTITTGIAQIMAVAGIWRPIPKSDWILWNKSMGRTINHPRGNANLIYGPETDSIIDICAGEGPQADFVDEELSLGGRAVRDILFEQAARFMKKPGKFESWIMYYLSLIIEPKDQIAELKLLPVAPVLPNKKVLQFSDADGYKSEYVEDVNAQVHVQLRANPSFYVTLVGKALRAQYRIGQPGLLAIGGRAVVPANRDGNGFVSGLVGNFGIPIYGAKWNLRYLVKGIPGVEKQVAGNPVIDQGFNPGGIMTPQYLGQR